MNGLRQMRLAKYALFLPTYAGFGAEDLSKLAREVLAFLSQEVGFVDIVTNVSRGQERYSYGTYTFCNPLSHITHPYSLLWLRKSTSQGAYCNCTCAVRG